MNDLNKGNIFSQLQSLEVHDQIQWCFFHDSPCIEGLFDFCVSPSLCESIPINFFLLQGCQRNQDLPVCLCLAISTSCLVTKDGDILMV